MDEGLSAEVVVIVERVQQRGGREGAAFCYICSTSTRHTVGRHDIAGKATITAWEVFQARRVTRKHVSEV